MYITTEEGQQGIFVFTNNYELTDIRERSKSDGFYTRGVKLRKLVSETTIEKNKQNMRWSSG